MLECYLFTLLLFLRPRLRLRVFLTLSILIFMFLVLLTFTLEKVPKEATDLILLFLGLLFLYPLAYWIIT